MDPDGNCDDPVYGDYEAKLDELARYVRSHVNDHLTPGEAAVLADVSGVVLGDDAEETTYLRVVAAGEE